MAKIKKVKAREVLDSRGNPTVEVDLIVENRLYRAMVPSGASKGEYEAVEIRDGGNRFLGKGVQKAVDNVNKIIAPNIIDKDTTEQESLDKLMIELDGTENKEQLGANAILAVSMAVCKAGASSKELPLYRHIGDLAGVKEYLLPVPSLNVINGGAHAGNDLAIQEYMILPVEAASFREAIQIGSEVYQTLKSIIKAKYGMGAINVGDEGGFAPPLESIEEPIELILQAVKKAGYEGKVKLGLDCAASEFFGKKPHEKKRVDHKYHVGNEKLSSDDLIRVYEQLSGNYPIISIEDPFEENDFNSYAALTASIGSDVQIVGDDLLVTNVKRIDEAIEKNACNALLLKLNQIGTITESIDAYKLAISHDWKVMVSHRSGETEDSFIADLVVGLAAGQIKSGAPCRGERTAKYNQLIRIEEELGNKARYAEHFR